MEPKRTKDLYSVVLPLYYVSKILGFIPFTLVGQTGTRKFKVSNLGLTYSTIIGIVSLMCHSLFFFYDYSEYSSEKVFSAAENLHSICHLIFSFVLYVILFMKNRSILDIINKLSDINIVHTNDYGIWNMILVCWIFIIFLIYISVIGIINLLSTVNNIALLISNNYGFFCSLIFSLIEVHFINIMFLLKKYFSTINSTICDVMNEFHSSEKTVHLKTVKGLNILSKTVISTKTKLNYLKELHCDMCNITELANSTYNMKMLFIIADKFCDTLSNAYFTVITILNYDKGPFSGSVWNITAICFMCFSAVQFILILWYASAAAGEVSVYYVTELP